MKVSVIIIFVSLFRTGLGFCRGTKPNIPHAQYRGPEILYDNHRQVGHVLEYRCDEGYIRKGGLVRCGPDLNWTTFECVVKCFKDYNITKVSQLGLTCGTPCKTTSDCQSGEFCKCDGPCSRVCVDENMNCGEPPVIENANVTISGFIAHYRCHEGYYLASGKLSMQCLGSGNIWDNSSESVCKPVLCGDPSASIYETHGMISGESDRYYYGAVVNFSCPIDYKLYGSPTRRCMGNGQWSGELAACDLTDLHTSTTSPCRDISRFCSLWKFFCGSNNVVRRDCQKTCRMCAKDRSPNRCPHPGRPINGRIIGENFSIGAIVRFECDEGYIMYGDAKQDCLYFREWSGTHAPRCVDYRYPHTPRNIVSSLARSIENLPAEKTNLGRRIKAKDVGETHEIYFMFDISNSDLEDATNFTARLVRRLEEFEATLHYYIILFAPDYVTLRNASLCQSSCDKMVDELQEIVMNVTENEYPIKSGSGPATCLEALKEVQSHIGSNENGNNSKKHIFMFLNGLPTDGKNPVKVKRDIESSYNYTEFYSITTCADCNEAEMKEMKELSSGEEGKNFVKIEDFYQLQQYVDQVTTVVENYSECGQIGNQESVNRLASSLKYKTDKGKNAEEDQWRWQVLITKRDETYAKTLLSDTNIIGGGFIINEQWILTAAHVLHGSSAELGSIALFVGIWERPKSNKEAVKKSVQAYKIKSYKEHTGFAEDYDNDIALIQVGARLHANNMSSTEETEGLTFGYYVRPLCLPCTGTCAKTEDLVDELGVSLINDAMSKEQKCRKEEEFLLDQPAMIVVTGFGHTEEEIYFSYQGKPATRLQVGFLQVATYKECENGTKFIEKKGGGSYKYTENMICCKPVSSTKPYDACDGDSGGAVARKVKLPAGTGGREKDEYCWVAIGIVSFGLGCARGDVPGYYTNVARYVQWIDETMTREIICPRVVAMQNSRIINNQRRWTIGDIAEFLCDDGYSMNNGLTRKNIECLSSGFWSDSSPTCIQGEATNDDTEYSGSGSGKGWLPNDDTEYSGSKSSESPNDDTEYSGTGSVSTTTPAPTTTPSHHCQNKYPQWCRMVKGHCDRSFNVRTYCKKTCGLCEEVDERK